MKFRTFVFATIFLAVGTILISNSECSPAPILPEIKANFVDALLAPVKEAVPQAKKLLRQGRYYMGYPLGGLGYGGGGAVASASASASASSGGLGMGYGGYGPMVYGK